MKFATKVFLAIFLPALGLALAISAAFYSYLATATRSQFVRHSQSVTQQVARSLAQLETTIDLLMASSVRVLAERVRQDGLPSIEALKGLRDELGITHLYIVNRDGDFIRSTNEDPKLLPNAFTFCRHYRRMFEDGTPFIPTGIMPGIPGFIPYKFLFLPSADHQSILEVGVRADFIGQTLRQTLSGDPELISLALYAPNGTSLGEFTADGHTSYERSLEPSTTFATGTVQHSDQLQVTERVAASNKECCSCRQRGLIEGGDYHYYLRTLTSTRSVDAALRKLAHLTIGLAGLGLLVSLLFSRWLSRRLVARLDMINEQAHAIMQTGDLSRRLDLRDGDELGQLSAQIDGMLAALQVKQAERIRLEKTRGIIETTQQIAHDIRSPLAALDTLLKLAQTVPEDQRILLRTAVQRIRDISTHLLEETRRLRAAEQSAADHDAPDAVTVASESLWLLIESVIAEKQHQHHARPDISIEQQQPESIYPLFVAVEVQRFRRVISNLIDNAVEAIDTAGRVTIRAQETADRVELFINDTGRGIPSEVLPTLMEQGRTYGKPGGSGLGLYGARQALVAWGGDLRLTSQVGKGTSVIATLPLAAAPPWFVPALWVEPGATVVVVDDDESIHEIWRNRFAADEGPQATLHHCKHPDELRNFCKEHRNPQRSLLVLMDYAFRGTEDNGLDCLAILGLTGCGVLVTSSADDPEVRRRCEELGVGLLPKGAAGFIPIKFSTP